MILVGALAPAQKTGNPSSAITPLSRTGPSETIPAAPRTFSRVARMEPQDAAVLSPRQSCTKTYPGGQDSTPLRCGFSGSRNMSSTSMSSLAGIFRSVNAGPTRLSLPIFPSGATPCIKTLRKPRRNSCVVNVAVLTPLRRFIAPSLNGFAITLLAHLLSFSLVDFWVCCARGFLPRRLFQKIKIATLISLQHVQLIQYAITACKFRLRCRPRGLSSSQFLFRNEKTQPAGCHVELD